MDRPKIDKPRLEEWHNDDEQLSTLLDHIDKKVLNVDSWEFRVAHLNKYVTYSEVLKNVQERYPSFEWVEALKDSFQFLPDKFRVIKYDLFTVFKRFTLNLQERLNYIQSMEKYVDDLEQQVETMKGQLDVLKQHSTIKGIHQEIESLKVIVKSLSDKQVVDIVPPEKPEYDDSEDDGVDDSEDDYDEEVNDQENKPIQSPDVENDPNVWK